ncbi:hypothetical protein F7Q93_15650 [Brucella pituitosa]|uniref:Uncharacterized protein n=1 Tax=Brucella pituitosa TaxID=571256 RepID=A0A643EZ08_9HYPH|nr:hypothetical protein F7Q93_15650 [Brucella pituitosa]
MREFDLLTDRSGGDGGCQSIICTKEGPDCPGPQRLFQKSPCRSANGNLPPFRCSRTFKYAALRYSKITIFASACRFLIQTLIRNIRNDAGVIPPAPDAGLRSWRLHVSTGVRRRACGSAHRTPAS